MKLRDALERVVARQNLDEIEAANVMRQILGGEAEPPWISGFLVALRMKGETVEEITGFAKAMRQQAVRIAPRSRPLIDTCGTGGDASGTFNVSTAAAFVAAGAGAHVAKHGNRSVSSKCGSADVLEALGARLDLEPTDVARCVDEVGLGFLFAPALHGAMRHAVVPRRALALRTVFNVLGPLTNPAGADHQVLGVFDRDLLEPMGEVLLRLGGGRSVLVHGDDGLDELTVTADSTMIIADEKLKTRRIDPSKLGLAVHPAAALQGGDAKHNASILKAILRGDTGAPRDIVLLNAAAALFAAGLVEDLETGVAAGVEAIEGGRAKRVMLDYIAFTKDHGRDG